MAAPVNTGADSAVIVQEMAPRRAFGGQYVSEALIECLQGLEEAFKEAWQDVSFQKEFETYLTLLRPPTKLQVAPRLSKISGGAQIYLKREDMGQTGGHLITNALGQALLAQRLNKTTVLAETGSGAHGIATAMVCKKLGLKCVVYMGQKDVRARQDQVKQMEMYGAQVVEVSWGEASIREAIAEVLRATVEQYQTAYPLMGGPYGPRPIPMIANTFQSIIGEETRAQVLSTTGHEVGTVIACAGIHSPAVPMFDTFIEDRNVQLVAVEAAGHGLDTGKHSAILSRGSPGVYNGAHTLILQNEHGQIDSVHSIAPDLCYPSISPWLAKWDSEGRIKPIAINDDEAILGRTLLSRSEGINCSIEDGHAVAAGVIVASLMSADQSIVVCLGGGL